MEDSQTWENIIKHIREDIDLEIPENATEEEKIKLIQEAITKVNQLKKGEKPQTMDDVVEKLHKLKEERVQPIKIDLSKKERYYEEIVSEEQFIERVNKDPYEASQLLSEAFKKIEIYDTIVKTMIVSQRVMNLLPCLPMKSGEQILSKTPCGLRFWTASIIVDDHIPHIELSSEDQKRGMPIFNIKR